MRFDIRRASLDDDLRDLFEQYGEQVVAMALALGSNSGHRPSDAPRRPYARDESRSYPSRCSSKVAHGEERLGRTSRDDWHNRERRPSGFYFFECVVRNYQLVPRSSLI